MALSDQQLAAALIGSRRQTSVAGAQRGIATSPSADGLVEVAVIGSTIGPEAASSLESDSSSTPATIVVPCIGDIDEGEVVVILTSGKPGGAHSMVAIGSLGGGDRLADAVIQASADASSALTAATGASASAAAALGQLSGLTLTPIWYDGSGWSSLASGVISQVRFEGLVASLGTSSGSRGILIGHLRALYNNASAENAWTSHGLARLTDWNFPVGMTGGITSSVRNFGLAVSISYIFASIGGRDISMIHADRLPATTDAWMHTDIISYVQHV